MMISEWARLPRVSLKEFFPELRYEFQNLPPEVYSYYLIQTAIDMAEKGNLLRYWEEIPLKKDVVRYSLTPPTDTKIWNVMGIFHSPRPDIPPPSDCPAPPVVFDPPDDEISDMLPNGAFFCHKNIAWYDPYTASLHYNTAHYKSGDSLYVNASLTMPDTICSLPQLYKDRFHQILMIGTEARLKLILDRKWTNLEVGAKLMEQYRVLLTTEAKWVAQRRQRWWSLAMAPDRETVRRFLSKTEQCFDPSEVATVSTLSISSRTGVITSQRLAAIRARRKLKKRKK